MKIHHIALTVSNLEKSISFYKNIFGFTEIKRFERKDMKAKAAFISLKDVSLELWEFEKSVLNKDNLSELNIIGIRHIAFEVDDIRSFHRILNSKSIEASEINVGASGAAYFFTKDPDGISLELYSSR